MKIKQKTKGENGLDMCVIIHPGAGCTISKGNRLLLGDVSQVFWSSFSLAQAVLG